MEVMRKILIIAVPFPEDTGGDGQHGLHVRVGHLARPVEQETEARILMESLKALFVFVVLQAVFSDQV